MGSIPKIEDCEQSSRPPASKHPEPTATTTTTTTATTISFICMTITKYYSIAKAT